MDTLAHHLLLLETDDERGTRRGVMGPNAWFGFAGALFAELQLQERVVPVSADRFAVASGEPLDGLLGQAEATITSRWPRPAAWCLYQLYQRSWSLRNIARADLVAAGELERVEDTVLGVRWRVRHPQADGGIERALIAHMREWLPTVPPDAPPGREDLLLSLLRGTRQLTKIWTEAEIAALRPKIVERTQMAPIGELVHDLALHGSDMSKYRGRGNRGRGRA